MSLHTTCMEAKKGKASSRSDLPNFCYNSVQSELCVCVSAFMYVCMYACVCMYVCTHTYIHIHTHTYTYTCKSLLVPFEHTHVMHITSFLQLMTSPKTRSNLPSLTGSLSPPIQFAVHISSKVSVFSPSPYSNNKFQSVHCLKE